MEVAQAWKKLALTTAFILHVMRLNLLCATDSNFDFTINHVAGTGNSIADALSRARLKNFFKLVPSANSMRSGAPRQFFKIIQSCSL